MGNDILTGGTGNDRFYITRNEGIDRITDFQNQDVIALSGGLTYSGLSFTQNINQTFVSETSTQQVLAILTGVQASSLTPNSLVTLGNNSTLSGFTISSGANPGISASNVGNFTIRNNAIASTTQGVLLENVTGQYLVLDCW